MESNVLTNDDFRKLLHKAATESTVKKKKPRFDGEGKSKGKKRKNYTKNPQKPNKTAKVEVKTAEDMEEEEELFYDKNKDYMKGYRDRAQERRDNKFDGNMMPQKHIYGAVAPEFGIKTLQERRDKLIEESKYLGGDMEHTHLVKGLDFALLGKVKTEITSKKIQKDKNIQQALKDASLLAKDDKIYFNSKMAKDIYNIAVIKKTATRADPKKFFANNRVAYVIEMDESIEIPTTVIRNFVPLTVEDKLSMQSTNDIVINKLIQMLSTMRQSKLNKKLSRKDKALFMPSKSTKSNQDQSIYPGLDDYHPEIEKNLKSERLPAHSDQHNSFVKRHSYFGKMEPEEPIKDSIDSEFINRIKKMNQESTNKNTELTKKKKISKGATDDTMNYMECYPGAAEWTEALGDDSEEEVDFSKMDTGSRKTTLGRWDFVDEEQYHKYQSKREAMPKAAFQYGKKTSDGRKTRRTKNKDTNASTDKEWQKIQKIIEKRL